MTDMVYRSQCASMWRLLGHAGDPRHGELCGVVLRGRGPGPHNVLIEFSDGHRMVVVKKAVRRARTKDRQLTLM